MNRDVTLTLPERKRTIDGVQPPPTLPTLREAVEPNAAPIEVCALLVARDEYEELDVSRYVAKLDQLLEPLAGRDLGGEAPDDQVSILVDLVYRELGFAGNRASYYDPKNSYLSDVIDRRIGIPITLAILWIALGRRVGVMMEGINTPGHFLVRIGGAGGILVDPFSGAVLDAETLELLAAQFSGRTRRFDLTRLPGATVLEMTVRVLKNLREIYEQRQPAHGKAMLINDRLFALTGDWVYRKARGLHAYRMGAVSLAVEDLSAYLAAQPTAPDAAAVANLLAELSKKSLSLA